MNLNTKQREILSQIATLDRSGSHYKVLETDSDLGVLEAAGLIQISKPICDSGFSSNLEAYRITVTAAGEEVAKTNNESLMH